MSLETGETGLTQTRYETWPLFHYVAMTLISLSQRVSRVRVRPIRMAFSMYACRVGGSKQPSFKDERWASVLPNLLHLDLFISTTALLSHGHRRPCGPPPQTDPLRFLSSSLFPYRAVFVRFKAFPSCFFPGPQRERGAGASETIALLSHWRPLLSPLLPTALAGSPWAGGIP